MLTKKHIYLSVLFGVSFLLFVERLGYLISSLVNQLLSFIDNNWVNSLISVFIIACVYLGGVVVCYLMLPSNHKKVSWLKNMIIIFSAGHVFLTIIGLVINIFRYGSRGASSFFDFPYLIRYFGSAFFLTILIITLTLIVYSMKDEVKQPPRIPRI